MFCKMKGSGDWLYNNVNYLTLLNCTLKNGKMGDLWWLSGLRIQHCHCRGAGSIPDPGAAKRNNNNKTKFNELSIISVTYNWKFPDFKKKEEGVPIVVQQKQIWLAFMRMQVRSLASISGLRIWCCCGCGVGHRHGLDLALLWLWYRPAATALNQPVAWEPPYAVRVALKKDQKKKKKKNEWINEWMND